MSIIGIVAIAKNYAIGKDGKLPWHYPADLKFFKKTTTGNAVIMGSTTWRSIKMPLPGRLNIVLSRSSDLVKPADVLVLRTNEEAVTLAKYLNCDMYIIGGAKTFKNFADVIEEWVVTEVPMTVGDADVSMPDNFLADFEQTELTEIEPGVVVKRFQRRQL
jgi:dihydrofolate reductase